MNWELLATLISLNSVTAAPVLYIRGPQASPHVRHSISFHLWTTEPQRGKVAAPSFSAGKSQDCNPGMLIPEPRFLTVRPVTDLMSLTHSASPQFCDMVGTQQPASVLPVGSAMAVGKESLQARGARRLARFCSFTAPLRDTGTSPTASLP